ncbi:serine hydrolase [Ramlibacter tataouinensis]|nr:serine hydrolase [Ramlibacter tataouinensis]
MPALPRLPFLRPRRRPPSRLAAALWLWCVTGLGGVAAAAPGAHWATRLPAELAAVDARHRGQIGVHVRDLQTGVRVNHHADQDWYIASMVKVPVAIAVLRGVEAGLFTLDTPLRLRAADYVDGAGATNGHPVATPLPIRFLMEQMIIHSDNTASDMLIELVGLPQVNALVRSLVPQGFGRITTLAEVRRQVYGQLTPQAWQLTGADMLRLHQQRDERDRLQLLSQITEVPVLAFKRKSLDAAYAAYYAGGLNSARLDAYGQLLALLAQGGALGPDATAYLLGLMERVATGPNRIRAGLPADARFAHKTGTQRQRVCDAGLVRMPHPGAGAGAVVVACVRGEASLARSEAALRDVGEALCRSGLFNNDPGDNHASSCPAPRLERLPAAAGAAERALGARE